MKQIKWRKVIFLNIYKQSKSINKQTNKQTNKQKGKETTTKKNIGKSSKQICSNMVK